MSILLKHLAFVNAQAEFHQKQAEKYEKNSYRSKLHAETAGKFIALAADLTSADSLLESPTKRQSAPRGSKGPQIQLSLTMDEIEDLPQELLEELNLSGADKTEFAILNAIEEAGGLITLNRLLIALYRKTGEVSKRQSLYSVLARLAQKNAIFYVPGKKGVYSSEPISSEDAERLFGGVKADVQEQ